MNTQAHRPTKFRINPIVIWAAVSITVLITAFLLWLGWPMKTAELPAGTSDVEVYLIDEQLTTPAATGEKDGWFGVLWIPCGTDAWYVESSGTAMCASLDGPHGTITVNHEGKQIELSADAQEAVKHWVTTADAGTEQRTTRVLLVRDNEAVGVVTVANLGTAVPVD